VGLSSQLSLEVWRAEPPAVVVSPRGDIDLSTLVKAAAALDAARPAAGAAGALILDLRDVGFMDTSGLRLIIEEQQRAAEGGYRFALVRGSSRVQRLFDIAGLTASPGLFVEPPARLARSDG
jgi:anti-sigma B factor antagonist